MTITQNVNNINKEIYCRQGSEKRTVGVAGGAKKVPQMNAHTIEQKTEISRSCAEQCEAS